MRTGSRPLDVWALPPRRVVFIKVTFGALGGCTLRTRAQEVRGGLASGVDDLGFTRRRRGRGRGRGRVDGGGRGRAGPTTCGRRS
jgi:hypothetical protein